MTKQILKYTLIIFAGIVFVSAIISCNSNNKPVSNDSSANASEKAAIPDTVIQFLITSAANDFREHHPPTAVDFRNIKIGYIISQENEKTFILCGEFLSKEKKEWVDFTTIKTSGYEQYIGKTKYCLDAVFVLADENLTVKLKNKITG